MHRRARAGSRYEYATRWLPTAPPAPGASGNRSRSRSALAQRPHPPRPRRLASMRRRRTSATGPRTARGGSGTAANTMIFEPCITTPRATQACPTRSPTPTPSTRARASKAGTPAARGAADGGGRGREETRDASLAVAAPAHGSGSSRGPYGPSFSIWGIYWQSNYIEALDRKESPYVDLVLLNNRMRAAGR